MQAIAKSRKLKPPVLKTGRENIRGMTGMTTSYCVSMANIMARFPAVAAAPLQHATGPPSNARWPGQTAANGFSAFFLDDPSQLLTKQSQTLFLGGHMVVCSAKPGCQILSFYSLRWYSPKVSQISKLNGCKLYTPGHINITITIISHY